MTTMKISDVTRTATLLKKLVARADSNLDGAVRNGEVAALAPHAPRAGAPEQIALRSAIHGAQRYAMDKGSVTVPDIQKAVATRRTTTSGPAGGPCRRGRRAPW